MAIRSMTGYGRGEAPADGAGLEVEISSVNRKQFDLRMNLPRALAVLESRIAKRVRSAVTRGCVVVNVRLSQAGGLSGAVAVNLDLARDYLRAFEQLQRELGVAGAVTIQSLLQCPDVVERCDLSADAERIWKPLDEALQAALETLNVMRLREGLALQKDIEKRFRALGRRHGQIARLAPSIPRRCGAALRRRIHELAPDGFPDAGALARELAVMADRSDISEELVRLSSHFALATELVEQPDSAGRAFDFLCQEMLREINTIGSKAGDARVSRHVIAFKTDLERVREQVQNIE